MLKLLILSGKQTNDREKTERKNKRMLEPAPDSDIPVGQR